MKEFPPVCIMTIRENSISGNLEFAAQAFTASEKSAFLTAAPPHASPEGHQQLNLHLMTEQQTPLLPSTCNPRGIVDWGDRGSVADPTWPTITLHSYHICGTPWIPNHRISGVSKDPWGSPSPTHTSTQGSLSVKPCILEHCLHTSWKDGSDS